MRHPFQWSMDDDDDDDDDDDEVYRVHEIQHYSRTRELSVPRLLTYTVQR